MRLKALVGTSTERNIEMSYTGRVKMVEKRIGTGNRTVHIKVEDYGSTEVKQDYAEYRARQVLGNRPADGRTETIFIVDPDTEEKYQDMTVEQAVEILRRAEKNHDT